MNLVRKEKTDLEELSPNIIPFVQGDAIGKEKRDFAIQDAKTQGPLQEQNKDRAKLYALQEAIGSLPEVDMPLQHVFAPGVYARTIFIPKGTVLVGKIHKHPHINILSQGDVFVVTEYEGVEHLVGPLTMVSKAGTKRAVYANEDTVWTTIHPTFETDLDKIEEEVIAKTYQEYDEFIKGKL